MRFSGRSTKHSPEQKPSKPLFSRSSIAAANMLSNNPENLSFGKFSSTDSCSRVTTLDTGLPFFDAISLCSFLNTSPEILKAVLNDINTNYHTFFINKVTGKICSYSDGLNLRRIDAPYRGLKDWQVSLLSIFKELPQHKANYAFVEGRSIIDAAKSIKDGEVLLHADLKDFFTEHTSRYVIAKLKEVLDNNNKTIDDKVLEMIVQMCTLNNVLPQGSPCSPMLTIILNYDLDTRICNLAESYNLLYSRYADDLWFSGAVSDTQAKNFFKDLANVVHPFRLNYKKLGIMRDKAYPLIKGCEFICSSFLVPSQSSKIVDIIKNAFPNTTVTLREKVILVEFKDTSNITKVELKEQLQNIKDKIEAKYRKLRVNTKIKYFYIQSVKTCLGLHITDSQVKFPRKTYSELRLQAMLMGRQRAMFRSKYILYNEDTTSLHPRNMNEKRAADILLTSFAGQHPAKLNGTIFRNLFLHPFNRKSYMGKLNYLKNIDKDKYDKLVAIEHRAARRCFSEIAAFLTNETYINDAIIGSIMKEVLK